MEVTKDKNKAGEEVATFHLKTMFFNGLPDAPAGPMPWYIIRAHMEYGKYLFVYQLVHCSWIVDKLWMQTSVNRLLK